MSVTGSVCKWMVLKGLLVDLIGIEPMTSSMPWDSLHFQRLTAEYGDCQTTVSTCKDVQANFDLGFALGFIIMLLEKSQCVWRGLWF